MNPLNYPQINCPGAYEKYDKKVVLLRIRKNKRESEIEGVFWVSPDSKDMRIDFVGFAGNVRTVDSLPIDDRTAQSIVPAPKQVTDETKGRVQFLIPLVLVLP